MKRNRDKARLRYDRDKTILYYFRFHSTFKTSIAYNLINKSLSTFFNL